MSTENNHRKVLVPLATVLVAGAGVSGASGVTHCTTAIAASASAPVIAKIPAMPTTL